MSGPGTPAGPAVSDPGSDAILRERARELAQARDEESADVQVILPFEVAGDRYAVEVMRVHQVLDSRRVHPLLGAPRGVIGAVVARTRPVPVLDLRHLLGLEAAASRTFSASSCSTTRAICSGSPSSASAGGSRSRAPRCGRRRRVPSRG